jgi:hypothetical protein
MVRKRVATVSRAAMIVLARSQDWLASQCWRFVAHEVRVISSKKEAFQALSIPQNVAWNPLTFRAQEIDESIDCGGKTLVNQRIRLRQFGVAFCGRPKGSKLRDRVPAPFRGKALLEILPSIHSLRS